MEYPATSASRMADMIRAHGNGLSATTPTPLTTSATRANGGGPPNPGLPIPSRQGAIKPSQGASVSSVQPALPQAAFQRRGQPYITAAVTTPLRAEAKRHREQQPKDSREEMNTYSSDTFPRWAARSGFSSGLDSGGQLPSQLSRSSSSKKTDSIRLEPHVFLQTRHDTLLEKYDIMACIGESRGCAVYTVKKKGSGNMYAAKVLQKVDHETKALLKEIEMLKKLDHPNIVKIYEVLEDKDALFLILELCRGGDLCDRIEAEGSLSEGDARTIMRQIFGALAYCHTKKVVHRDVKAENFLLATQDAKCLNIKLTDFGISTAIRQANMSSYSSGSREWPSFCECSGDGSGTLPYMAPEIFMHHDALTRSDATKCDLWSAGVLLFFMLSGDFPYGAQPHQTPDLICSGKACKFSGDHWQNVSESAKDLIRKLLNHDVDVRINARQALQHPWLHDEGSPMQELELGGFDNQAGHGAENSPRNVARVLLQALQSWRKKSPLRRWAIAAMARHLPDDCETQRLAKTIYTLFSEGSNTLKSEQLVDILSEAAADQMSECPSVTSKGHTSTRSWKSMFHEGDITRKEVKKKLREVRHDVQSVFKRITSLPDTPTPTTCDSSCSDSPFSIATSDIVQEDIPDLISGITGDKHGTVQYTLLVAALLPEHVYCDDLRISEVFRIFDVRGNGRIRPSDLRVALQCPKGHPGRFSQIVRECDFDGDGAIDLAEFRSMVRGEMPTYRL